MIIKKTIAIMQIIVDNESNVLGRFIQTPLIFILKKLFKKSEKRIKSHARSGIVSNTVHPD
jgi:hypothetical protein